MTPNWMLRATPRALQTKRCVPLCCSLLKECPPEPSGTTWRTERPRPGRRSSSFHPLSSRTSRPSTYETPRQRSWSVFRPHLSPWGYPAALAARMTPVGHGTPALLGGKEATLAPARSRRWEWRPYATIASIAGTSVFGVLAPKVTWTSCIYPSSSSTSTAVRGRPSGQTACSRVWSLPCHMNWQTASALIGGCLSRRTQTHGTRNRILFPNSKRR